MKKLLLVIFMLITVSAIFAQNNCLSFDGSDYVSTDCTAQLNTWTVECWVKGDSSPTTGYSAVVYRGANFQINWNHDQADFQGTVALYVSDVWYPASFGTLEANVWYHLAGTYDGENLKAYKNGILITDNGSPYGYVSSTNQQMMLGASGESYGFDGLIDEVRIWNDVRDVNEIRQNMYRELPNPSGEANLVAYYKFNETSGTTSYDSKGSYNGTLENYGSQTGYWQTSPAFFGPKNCLDFDGTDDYVNISSELLYNGGSNITSFTEEAWIYSRNTNDYHGIMGANLQLLKIEVLLYMSIMRLISILVLEMVQHGIPILLIMLLQ